MLLSQKKCVISMDGKIQRYKWYSSKQSQTKELPTKFNLILKMYEDPTWYSKFSEDHQKETQWALDQFLGKLEFSDAENVLDVGCGSGDATNNIILKAMPESVKKLVGVDMSATMINFARSKWSNPGLSFSVLDVATTDDPLKAFDEEIRKAGGFDKLFSFFCLQWVKDKKKMAENLNKLLKPGGQAYILLVVRSGVYNVWDKLGKSEKWKPYLKDLELPLNDYVYMDDYGEYLTKIMTEAGFVVEEIKSVERQNVFVTKTNTDEEITLRLRSVDPFVRLLPEEMKKEYLDELREMVKKEVSPSGATDYTGLHMLLRKKK